jgi:acetyl esterase/lipase
MAAPQTTPGETRRGFMGRTLAVGSTALAAAGCTPVGMLNAVAGRDGGSASLASDIAYGSHPRQRLDIYGPQGRTGPSPVVVFFYGGSWNSGSREEYAFVGRSLAARGFLTVIPDYRLVPEVVFPAFLDDGALAVRWVRDNISRQGGDPRRMALVGHSAGAYNALMLALDARILGRAGVRRTAIRAVAGLSGPYDFLPFTSPAAEAAFGSAPDLAETQPVTFAGAGAPPAFLATGDADTLVSAKNTRTLAARLRASGGIVDERIYPGVSHAGTLTGLSWLLRGGAPVLDDLTRYLGTRLVERP